MSPSITLHPPFRFGVIEQDLFRGAYPKSRNCRFLTRLFLKTIISLTPEPPNPQLVDFCVLQKINLIHIRVDKPKDSIPLTYGKVTQCLGVMINPINLPLFIHCLDGAVNTGVVTMCLRKLQMWAVPSAMVEYTRFIRDGVIGSEEAEFVEKFQTELDIPRILPKWLWGGQATFRKHPTLKIRLPSYPTSSSAAGGSGGIDGDGNGSIGGTGGSVGLRVLSEKEEYRKRVNADLLGEDVGLGVPGISEGDGNGIEEIEDEADLSMTLQALALEGLKD